MLKKLFIHEWKDTWRLVALLNAIVVGLTLIGCIFLRNDAFDSVLDDSPGYLKTLMILYLIFYIASVFALNFVVELYFYERFYHNLYTDQGYLMHTLPVTAHELIWSKAFVALLWNIISTVVVVFAILSLVLSAMTGVSLPELLRSLLEELQVTEFDMRIPLLILAWIVAMLAASVMSVFMGYAAISIGQRFKKQKLLGAVGIYIGLYMLIQMASSYMTTILITINARTISSISIEPLNAMLIMMLIAIIATGALAAVFYVLTHYMMENQLNLE
jgi:hypothetical protein